MKANRSFKGSSKRKGGWSSEAGNVNSASMGGWGGKERISS